MKTYRVLLLAGLFLTAGCSSAAKSVAVRYKPVSEMLGISTHLDMCKDPSNAAGMAACNYQFAQLQAAGITKVRTDFTWSGIEPQQGVFDFSGYDSMVNTAAGYGLSITAILDYGNAWADTQNSSQYPPDDPQTFADFAHQVALHFKGRVERYEIWNEENTFQFWPPAGNPQAYGALLKAAYPAVKSADPDAVVAFGGVYMWNWAGAVMGGADFIDKTLTLYPDLGNYMDAVAFHPYMNYPPSVAPDFSSTTQESFDQMIDDVKTVLRKHGVAKPLWITEIGWPTYPPVDGAMQARWLVRTYLEAFEQGMDSVYWYDFIDGTGCAQPVQECYFGLFNYITAPSTSTPPQAKQSYAAFKALDDILGSVSFNRDESSQFGLHGARALYFASQDNTRKAWVFFAVHGTPDQTITVSIPSLTFYDISGTTFTPPVSGSGYSLTVTTSPIYAIQ